MLCFVQKTPICPSQRRLSVKNTIISFRLRQRYYLYFSLAWLAGLIAGALTATQSAAIHNSLTQSLCYSRLSVVGFLASLSVPFLLSAIFFKMSLFGLVIPLILWKAFSYSWCVCAVLVSLADAGWLISRLLLFSDSVVTVLLLWFWFRGLDRESTGRQVDLLLCLVMTLSIGSIDCCVISPFGISLLLQS